MHIVLVAQFAWEGGRLYLESLARCLMSLPSGSRPRLTWIQVSPGTPHPEIEDNASVVRLDRISSPQNRHEKWCALVRRLAVSACAIRACPSATFPANGPAWLPRGIAWLPDFQHEHLPHMFSSVEVASRRRMFASVAERARRVVLSSQTARNDFSRLYPRHAHKARVLQFATPLTARDLVPVELPVLPERYAYLPNQFWRHKDHPTAFRALAHLRAEGLTIPLVCTGTMNDPRHPEWSAELTELAVRLGIREQLVLLGLLPRSVQLQVLLRAHVVVQPSLFEGWSTVVEDARALGRPIVLSRIPTHEEQAPPNGSFFTPGDAIDLKAQLRTAWTAPVTESASELLLAAASAQMTRVASEFKVICA